MTYRVLLIDDNQDFRDAVTTRLTAEGFEVRAARSGREGLATIAAQPCDLVLLDMLMPEQDGIATYQQLRANPATRQIPVILLTAVAVEGYWDVLPYETDGPAFLLGKPYDYHLLVARIHQVLQRDNELGGRKA